MYMYKSKLLSGTSSKLDFHFKILALINSDMDMKSQNHPGIMVREMQNNDYHALQFLQHYPANTD